MKLRSEVEWKRDDGDSGYLFDRRTGALFGMNSAAAEVLRGIEKGLDEEDIARHMRDRFDVSSLAVREDVLSLVELLKRHDLVRE